MKNELFFSIVIPAYNRRSTIVKTITSVINQTFKNYELIIVDDGSTDQTAELIQKEFGEERRIRVFRQINKERGAARNYGIKNAVGQYIVFLDSDDFMMSDHLQTLYDYIHKIDFPDFIATKFEFIDESGNKKSSEMLNLKEGYYNYKLFLNGNILACNVCVKRENKDLHLFVEDRKYSIKEDWLFNLQNLFFKKIYIIDLTTILMLDHPDRSMRGDNSKIIKNTLNAGEWIKRNLPLTTNDLRLLYAHINYFCAIHSYLEHKRLKTIVYDLTALKYGGLKKKYLVLLAKGILGRKIIKKLN